MANFQIKNMDDDLYASLKEVAALENRSVSQQVQYMLKRQLARKGKIDTIPSPAQALLELAGSWEDSRSAEEIVQAFRSTRRNSPKLSQGL